VSNRRSPSPPFALGIADGPRNGRYRQRRQQPVGFGGETLAAAGGRVGNADRAAGYPLRSISRPRLVPPPDSAYQAVGQDKLTEGYTGGGMGGPNPTSHAFGPRRFGRLRTPHAAASGRLHCPAMHRSLTFQNNFGAKNVDLTLTPFVLLLKEDCTCKGILKSRVHVQEEFIVVRFIVDRYNKVDIGVNTHVEM
jgi:hypothetical protein